LLFLISYVDQVSELLVITHDESAHYHRDEMIDRLKKLGFFWWTRMKQDCMDYVKSYEICHMDVEKRKQYDD
jgi:hypothetical protein